MRSFTPHTILCLDCSHQMSSMLFAIVCLGFLSVVAIEQEEGRECLIRQWKRRKRGR